ncbi:MAG: hypothetical protein JWR72_4160 [Flavisolibacter sp.]|jgi:acylphosphatase|nr:hypothetical protein [Flavisolibacter sp.]
MKTIHLLIKGKVQGVFYRATAKEKASGLKLSGWIKNTRDGHVEAVASGEEDDLQSFIAWCKKGPPGAQVKSVEITETQEKFTEGFLIIRE